MSALNSDTLETLKETFQSRYGMRVFAFSLGATTEPSYLIIGVPDTPVTTPAKPIASWPTLEQIAALQRAVDFMRSIHLSVNPVPIGDK